MNSGKPCVRQGGTVEVQDDQSQKTYILTESE